MTTEISTDLERFRTWLGQNDYHDPASNPDVYNEGRGRRDDVLRLFAIELSVNLRYYLADAMWSSDKKLERIAEAHADFECNCAEVKALFTAWMKTPAEAPQDGHVYSCCGKVGRISRHESWCAVMKEEK